jgi:hypothetical protein
MQMGGVKLPLHPGVSRSVQSVGQGAAFQHAL